MGENVGALRGWRGWRKLRVPCPRASRWAIVPSPCDSSSLLETLTEPATSAMTGPTRPPAADPGRAKKFRQAAFVYLHSGLLYEPDPYTICRLALLPTPPSCA